MQITITAVGPDHVGLADPIIHYVTGHGVYEATHGTAPKYAGQDKVNPSSVLLSGVLMFEHLGWQEAADDIVRAVEATIGE